MKENCDSGTKMLMFVVLSAVGLLPYGYSKCPVKAVNWEESSIYIYGASNPTLQWPLHRHDQLQSVTPESCFLQRCLGCSPADAASPGSPVECQPSNWVTAEWIHNLGHPPPSTDSRVPVEYRCLKMVATPDDKTLGNTVDSVRGCIPKVQIDSVCLALKALERARGHSDARCYICYGNNCNSASTIRPLTLYIFVIACFIYYLPLS